MRSTDGLNPNGGKLQCAVLNDQSAICTLLTAYHTNIQQPVMDDDFNGTSNSAGSGVWGSGSFFGCAQTINHRTDVSNSRNSSSIKKPAKKGVDS